MRGKLFFLTTLLLAAGLGGWAYNLHAKIEAAPQVYLEIAPRDPRAFMMGDYMSLDYAFMREAAFGEDVTLYENPWRVMTLTPSEGRQLTIRKRNREWLLPTEYYFQEGQAEKFDNARYAAFKVLLGEKLALVGLTDEKFNLIERGNP